MRNAGRTLATAEPRDARPARQRSCRQCPPAQQRPPSPRAARDPRPRPGPATSTRRVRRVLGRTA